MPTASSLAWKTSLEESGRCGIAAWIKGVALYLWLIVVISVEPIDRCSNIWASLPGAGYGQFEHKADSLIAKFKEAGGTVRDWCMNGVTAIISALVICIIICLSWAVNHCRDNAITYKAQRDKNARRAEAGERGNYWHADASAWCCCARCKMHEELADAKAENDALRDDVAAGRWWLLSKQSVSQCVKPPPPPAWIMRLRLADTAEQDYFTLREADHYAKTAGGTPKYINEQCR